MEFLGMIGEFVGLGNTAVLLIGAGIGWCVPQPDFMKPITIKVCEKLGLGKFHREGHDHSEEHEAAIEAAEAEKEEK